jgi:hypothetical protein
MAAEATELQAPVKVPLRPHNMGTNSSSLLNPDVVCPQLYPHETCEPEPPKSLVKPASLKARPRFPLEETGVEELVVEAIGGAEELGEATGGAAA